MTKKSVIEEVASELAQARAKFGKFASAHEGFAVLDEERDELWDEVKGNAGNRNARMRAEAIQIAAMAVRFVEDVCDATKAAPRSAERAAEWALKQLAKEDLLYTHHGEINARPSAYVRLGEMLEAYATQRESPTSCPSRGGTDG